MLRLPKVTGDNPLANMWVVITLGKTTTLINSSSMLCLSHGFSPCRGPSGTGHRGQAWAPALLPINLAAWANPSGA